MLVDVLFGVALVASAASRSPPSLDDLWAGTASFGLLRSTPVNAPGFTRVDAGTRVVVGTNGSWHLFGRWDQGATTNCPQTISINVRTSSDEGRTWGEPHLVAAPDGTTGRLCVPLSVPLSLSLSLSLDPLSVPRSRALSLGVCGISLFFPALSFLSYPQP